MCCQDLVWVPSLSPSRSSQSRAEQRFGSLLVRKLLEIGGARVMGHGRGEGGSDECDGRGRRWMEQVKRGREGTGQD